MAQSPYKDHTMLHWNSQSPVERGFIVLIIQPEQTN